MGESFSIVMIKHQHHPVSCLSSVSLATSAVRFQPGLKYQPSGIESKTPDIKQPPDMSTNAREAYRNKYKTKKNQGNPHSQS
jgi:hypothetical protein